MIHMLVQNSVHAVSCASVKRQDPFPLVQYIYQNQLQSGCTFRWAHDYVENQPELEEAHRIFKAKALHGPKYKFGVMVPQNLFSRCD